MTPEPVELLNVPVAEIKTTLGVIASTTSENDVGVSGTIIVVVGAAWQQALNSTVNVIRVANSVL